MEKTQIELPARLVDVLRQVQGQIEQMTREMQAVLLGARVALGVPDDWEWNGAGWVAPEGNEGEGVEND
jgi:hypothetical protein